MNKTHQPAGQVQLSMIFWVLGIFQKKKLKKIFCSGSFVTTLLKMTKWVPTEKEKKIYVSLVLLG